MKVYIKSVVEYQSQKFMPSFIHSFIHWVPALYPESGSSDS